MLLLSPESSPLLDQQILFLLAGFQRGQEPTRALAAAGPGFAAGRITVFRRDLAGFAAALFAVNLSEGDAFGLEHRVDLGLDLGDFLLVDVLHAPIRLADEVPQLFLVERGDVDGHVDSDDRVECTVVSIGEIRGLAPMTDAFSPKSIPVAKSGIGRG